MNLYAALPFFLGIEYVKGNANAFEPFLGVNVCPTEYVAITQLECKENAPIILNAPLIFVRDDDDSWPYGCAYDNLNPTHYFWSNLEYGQKSANIFIICKKSTSQSTGVDFSAWDVTFKSCDFEPDDDETNVVNCSFETLTKKNTKIVFSSVVNKKPTCNDEAMFGGEGVQQNNATIFTRGLDISPSVSAAEKNNAENPIVKYFCVKANVHDNINEEDVVVNFSSKLIKLEMTYNSEGTFAVIDSVKIEEKDISSETRIRNELVKIKAFRCSQSTGVEITDNAILKQGDVLSLCIKPESAGISISEIKALKFLYGSNKQNSYEAIAGSSTNAVTSSTCPWDDGEMCMVDTLIIASLISDGNGEITASGVAGIEYERRSLNGEELDPRRLIQSENEEDVEFNILIALAEPVAESRIVLSGSLGMNYPVAYITILLGMFSLLV